MVDNANDSVLPLAVQLVKDKLLVTVRNDFSKEAMLITKTNWAQDIQYITLNCI